jgi:hypothetical protein
VLSSFQTVSTLPSNFKRQNDTAEIAVNAAGSMLYGSNRGHNSIAMFAIDPVKRSLTAIGHAPTLGSTPRHFAIDPTGESAGRQSGFQFHLGFSGACRYRTVDASGPAAEHYAHAHVSRICAITVSSLAALWDYVAGASPDSRLGEPAGGFPR